MPWHSWTRSVIKFGSSAMEQSVYEFGQKAQNLGVPASFEAPIAGSELWDAYKWADTCLVPLRDWPAFAETVPSKIYEIAATGKHLTLSGRGDAAEIVNAAGAGAVVPPDSPDELAKQLQRLDEDRSLLLVGEGPRRWVEAHADYNMLARKYEEFLIGLVNGGGRHRRMMRRRSDEAG